MFFHSSWDRLRCSCFNDNGMSDPQIPGSSTDWILWHRDTFDHETPPIVEAEGTGIIDGLRELWKSVLSEGIDDSGTATFSSFHLAWGGTAGEQISVHVATAGNVSLLKLRQWAGLSAVASSRPDVEGNEVGVRTGDALIQRLARWHYRLLQQSARWTEKALYRGQESLALLEGIESVREAHQIESVAGESLREGE